MDGLGCKGARLRHQLVKNQAEGIDIGRDRVSFALQDFRGLKVWRSRLIAVPKETV